MADRDIMELQEQEGVYTRGDPEETVRGAGRVGIIAASYESWRQSVLIAGVEQGLISGGPDATLVSRGEAVRGMQSLEQRAAQAIAGNAARTA